MLAPEFAAPHDRQHLIAQYENCRQSARGLAAWWHSLHVGVAGLQEEGPRVSDAGHFAALAADRRRRERLPSERGALDMLMVRGIDGELSTAERCGSNIFSRQWLMPHTPDATMPFGRGPSGPPPAMRLVGRHGTDTAHLAAGDMAGAALAG